jgi:hypothetical protein
MTKEASGGGELFRKAREAVTASHISDWLTTYKVTLPKDIPAANFWSLTVYDNQTRSMLDTPQRYPRAGKPAFGLCADTTGFVAGSTGSCPTFTSGRMSGAISPRVRRVVGTIKSNSF